MSDLISRNDLTNKIRGIVPGSQDVDFIVRLIDEQPTAYNPEKVVEEIKEATFGVDVTYTDSEDVVESEEAIRIIRKGGVE
jgi:hypothetical protein